jgi:hypothetical protein
MKWIEVNIERPSDVPKDNYLTKLLRPIINEAKDKIDSWHFLWEGKPWPSTLRLRFLGDDENIKQLQQFLEKKLKDIPHCYGEHGDCSEDKEYKGEADTWGTKAWEKGIRFLEFGAEFALDLAENKDKLGKSDEYKKNAFSYADRYTHLFLNQISSLVNEVDFDLKEGIFRYACQIGKTLSRDSIHSIIERTKQQVHIDC